MYVLLYIGMYICIIYNICRAERGAAYHSNGPKCEEFQHGCGCRTRKRRRPAARIGRGRGPPYRSRRRNRSRARNCSRWSPHPRSPTLRKDSHRRLRGIEASMPFSVEYSLAREPQSPPLRSRCPFNKTCDACARWSTELFSWRYISRAASILPPIPHPFVVKPVSCPHAHLRTAGLILSFHSNSHSFV